MNEMERQVMDMLLAGDDPILGTLRGQLAVANVAGRHFTGVGFFTHFEVPVTAARLASRRRLTISDVHAEIAGLALGAGFVLFVEDGALSTLECFIYEDAWPADAKLLRPYYMRPVQAGESALTETAERDLDYALEGPAASD